MLKGWEGFIKQGLVFVYAWKKCGSHTHTHTCDMPNSFLTFLLYQYSKPCVRNYVIMLNGSNGVILFMVGFDSIKEKQLGCVY